MDTNPIDIAGILVKKYKKQVISDEEESLLQYWLAKDGENKLLHEKLLRGEQELDSQWLEHINLDAAWENLHKKRNKKKSNRLAGLSIAASVLLLLSLGIYYILPESDRSNDHRFVESPIAKHKNDILPANLGARIILASGEEVKVDDTLSVASHKEFMQAGEPNALSSKENAPVFNTLVVPAANFFKLTLSDGTAVWVNAKSELRFPTQFAANERRVFLSGEAYFEVAKDADKPFYVETEDTEVRVLGTHFNVSAYGEYSKTSLAEGRVQVITDANAVVISPGQSAQLVNGHIKVKAANLQKDLAWKNNEFFFKEDNIVNISHQLKLWYDLEVSLAKEVSLTETYSGEIRRDARLSEVLQMLEYVSDLDFRLDKNKLLITKNKG